MKENRYCSIILKKLIEKYERRYFHSSSFERNISVNFKEKELPDYVNEDSYLYIFDIEEACNLLKNKGFIQIIKSQKYIIKVILCISKIDEIYEFLGAKRPSLLFDYVLNKISFSKSNCLSSYLKEIQNGNVSKRFVVQLYDKIDDLVKIVDSLEILETEQSIRDFSATVLGDSKRLINLITNLKILYKESQLSDDEFLLKHKLTKNPSPVLVKGSGSIFINGQEINLRNIGTPIGLYIDDLTNISISLEKEEQIVTTIENLTTFYDYQSKGLIIYLAGYASNNKVNFLKSINNYNHCDFYHFGDMDYGGFAILSDLLIKTELPFVTIHMDIDTLKNNYPGCQRNLKDSYFDDMKRLLSVSNLSSYYDTIRFLIDNKLVLEQENIDL